MLFELGAISATPGALEILEADPGNPGELLARHMMGDWGDVDQVDKEVNDRALRVGGRLLSAYTLTSGERIWIITEADRSSTTILRPDDY